MGVHFVRVITKEEEEQGAKLIGGFLAVLFALVAVYFAVVYWKVTLVVIGVLVLISACSAIGSRWSSRK